MHVYDRGVGFERQLEQAAGERQRRIRTRNDRTATPFPPMPSGYRAEDHLDPPERDGFLTVSQVAAAMGISEAGVVDAVQRGLLETRGNRVRPAIVSVLRTRTTEATPEPAGPPGVGGSSMEQSRQVPGLASTRAGATGPGIVAKRDSAEELYGDLLPPDLTPTDEDIAIAVEQEDARE